MVLDRDCFPGTVVNGSNFIDYLPSNLILNSGVPKWEIMIDLPNGSPSQLGEIGVVLAEFIYSNKVK